MNMSIRKISKTLQFLKVICFSEIVLASATEPADEVYRAAIDKGKLAVDWYTKRSGKKTSSDYYADICAYYGSCIFGDAIEDNSIYEYINSRYKRTNPINTGDIDQNSCGILPLHLYLHNKNTKQLKLGTDAADANIKKGGHFRNAIDDTYMTGSLLVQAYRATKNNRYLDFCADYMVKYINALQQSNGLYWHRNVSKQFWGRGNGWAAAGNAELIQIIPKGHKRYNEVITGFKKHMKGLIDVQLDNGMWPQLLASKDPKNWEETSGTSMFIFALFTGLEIGILDKETFLEPAKKGWMAVIKHLSNDGRLNNIARGFWPRAGTPQEYLNAPKGGMGDSHGTAGFIWAATAIIRYYKSEKTGVIQFSNQLSHLDKKTVDPVQQWSLFDLRGRKILTVGHNFNTMILPNGIVILSNCASNRSIYKMIRTDCLDYLKNKN
jgi:rhamnogalacturonyl hydrolase YesR